MKKILQFAILLPILLAACTGTAPAALPQATIEGSSNATPLGTQAAATSGSSSEEASLPEAAPQGEVTYTILPEGSSVTYEVGETFLREGNVFQVAVGKTQGVNGDIQLNFDQPQESRIGPLSIDITGLRSDSDRRDSAIQDRFLQSAQYPTVVFNPTAIKGLPETIEPGVEYTFTVEGDLTIRDTTRPAAFEVRASLEGDTLAGQASTTFLMSDFGFGPIDMLGMLKTEDEVKILVEFTARA